MLLFHLKCLEEAHPFVLESPKSLTVLPKRPFSLNCSFSKPEDFTLQWRIDGRTYRTEVLPHRLYTTETSDTYAVLRVKRAGMNGTSYQCLLVGPHSNSVIASEVAVVHVVGEYTYTELLLVLLIACTYVHT